MIATPTTLDSIVKAASPYAVIELEPGIYTGSPLIFSNLITIKGRPAATIKRQIQPTGSGISLEDLNFEGPFVNGAGIYGYNAPNLKVLRCNVTRSNEQSIMIDRCNDSLVEDCKVFDSGIDAGSSGHHGIYIANSSRVEVFNSSFDDVAAFGIQIGPKTFDTRIINCSVDGCGQFGLTIWGGSARNLVKNSSFANCQKGPVTAYQAGPGNIVEDSFFDKPRSTSLSGIAFINCKVEIPDSEPDPCDPFKAEIEALELDIAKYQSGVDAALLQLRAIKRPGKRVIAAINSLQNI